MASFPVVVNSSNRENINTYKISFPNVVNLDNYSVSVGQAFLYYSYYNINSYPLNNNQFSLSFPGYLSGAAQLITIPDGCYEISDLNNFLQYWMAERNLYLTETSSGLRKYYASFSVSPTAYAIQINTTPIESSLPTGYTNAGAIVFNGTDNRHPQITISSNNNFKDIIGFNAGTYPTTSTAPGSSNYTKLSDYIPNVNPISSIEIRLSCVYNPFSSNSTVLHCGTNGDSRVGEIMDISPKTLQYVPCQGSWKDIKLQFFDQSGRILQLLDPNITIKLLFKKDKQDE